MTSKVMKTFYALSHSLCAVRECVSRGGVPATTLPALDEAIVEHLKALNEEIAGLRGDVKRAEQEFEKKDAALKIAGEELRAAQELNRSYARQLAGAEESPALMTILGALVDAQRIMADWIHPDGIRARRAMEKMTAVLDNETLVLAMREFEKPRNDRG